MPSFAPLARLLDRAWPTASLRTYMVAVILLATVPMAAFMSYEVVADIRADQAQTEEELARSAFALSQTAERELNSSLDALSVLSQSEVFQAGRITSLGRLLQGRPRRDWDSLFVLEPGGKPVLDTAGKPGAADLAGPLHQLQREVAQTRHPAVLTLPAATAAGGGGVAVALPVMQGGELRYVLGARMGEAVWQRLARAASIPKGAQAPPTPPPTRRRRHCVSSPAACAAPATWMAASSMPHGKPCRRQAGIRGSQYQPRRSTRHTAKP
jgi:hypothetical protein